MQDGLQLFALLDACKTRIEEGAYFSGMTILSENEKDITTEINTALASLGVVVVLGDVEAHNKMPNASKPVWFPITFSAIVSETPLINRSASGSGKTAQAVADNVAEQLHHFASDWGTVVAVAIRPLGSKKYNVYEVELQIGE